MIPPTFVLLLLTQINSLPEMAGGWGGELMRRESEFMVLDGMMTAIAAICLTVAHPGIYFPTRRAGHGRARVNDIPRTILFLKSAHLSIIIFPISVNLSGSAGSFTTP
jgi:hypothetical protein